MPGSMEEVVKSVFVRMLERTLFEEMEKVRRCVGCVSDVKYRLGRRVS